MNNSFVVCLRNEISRFSTFGIVIKEPFNYYSILA